MLISLIALLSFVLGAALTSLYLNGAYMRKSLALIREIIMLLSDFRSALQSWSEYVRKHS